MNETQSDAIACFRCGAKIDAVDTYCRYCGVKLSGRDPLYYNPVVILLLALLILGPFALPLVWKAPRMHIAVKWALGLIIMAYTVIICWRMWVLFMFLFQEMSQLQRVMN